MTCSSDQMVSLGKKQEVEIPQRSLALPLSLFCLIVYGRAGFMGCCPRAN